MHQGETQQQLQGNTTVLTKLGEENFVSLCDTNNMLSALNLVIIKSHTQGRAPQRMCLSGKYIKVQFSLRYFIPSVRHNRLYDIPLKFSASSG